MQNLWSLTGRGIAVSALALALTACQSMRGPEPVAQANIPSSYSNASGSSVAEQGYKDFFADQRLLQVLDLALTNNRDLRTAALNIQRAQQHHARTHTNTTGDIQLQFTRPQCLTGKSIQSRNPTFHISDK